MAKNDEHDISKGEVSLSFSMFSGENT